MDFDFQQFFLQIYGCMNLTVFELDLLYFVDS
jgi:hypothetical protein